MTILEEIRKHFAGRVQNAGYELTTLPNTCRGFVFREAIEYGVAIPYEYQEEISERFSNCRFYTRTFAPFSTPAGKCLVLTSSDSANWYEFAALATEFVDPGENGSIRNKILTNPASFWNSWKSLLGNTESEVSPFSVIGELMAYEYLLSVGERVTWSGPMAGTHDFEGRHGSYEVKSTTQRYGISVVIHGEHQLQAEKQLELLFCRMEKSPQGASVNDMVERLVHAGIDRFDLEQKLMRLGLEKGSGVRNEKYTRIEGKIYTVDEKFPKIVDSSFVGGVKPLYIDQIQYRVNLESLECGEW